MRINTVFGKGFQVLAKGFSNLSKWSPNRYKWYTHELFQIIKFEIQIVLSARKSEIGVPCSICGRCCIVHFAIMLLEKAWTHLFRKGGLNSKAVCANFYFVVATNEWERTLLIWKRPEEGWAPSGYKLNKCIIRYIQIFYKFYVHHCMLYEFQGWNATQTMKNIYVVHRDVSVRWRGRNWRVWILVEFITFT